MLILLRPCQENSAVRYIHHLRGPIDDIFVSLIDRYHRSVLSTDEYIGQQNFPDEDTTI